MSIKWPCHLNWCVSFVTKSEFFYTTVLYLLCYPRVWMAGQNPQTIWYADDQNCIRFIIIIHFWIACILVGHNIIPANLNVLALWFRAKGWEMNWQMTMSTVKHRDRLWHCLVECLCVSEFWSSPFGVAVRQELLPTVVNPFPPRPFDPLILPNQENCLLSPLTYIPMLGLKAALSPHHMKLCRV